MPSSMNVAALYVAIFELSVAARTDKELGEILRPAQLAFDRDAFVRRVKDGCHEILLP